MLGLLGELVRHGGVAEGLLPTPRQPLQHAEGPAGHSTGDFVPAGFRLFLHILEHSARAVDLPETHPESGEREARAAVEREHQPAVLLDLRAALQETGRDVGCIPFRRSDPCDRGGHKGGVTDPLCLLQDRPSIRQSGAEVGLEQVDPGAISKNPRGSHIVSSCLSHRLIAHFDHPRRLAHVRLDEPEQNVGALGTGRDLHEKPFE